MRVGLVGGDLMRAGGGVNEHAAMAAKVEVVGVHLFQVVVGRLAVPRDLPFGVQDDASLGAGVGEVGDYIRADGFGGPKAPGCLAGDIQPAAGVSEAFAAHVRSGCGLRPTQAPLVKSGGQTLWFHFGGEVYELALRELFPGFFEGPVIAGMALPLHGKRDQTGRALHCRLH